MAVFNGSVVVFSTAPDGQQCRPPSKLSSSCPQLAATAFRTRVVWFLKVSCCRHFDMTGDFPVLVVIFPLSIISFQ